MEVAVLQKEKELDQCKVCSYPVCTYAELPLMSDVEHCYAELCKVPDLEILFLSEAIAKKI